MKWLGLTCNYRETSAYLPVLQPYLLLKIQNVFFTVPSGTSDKMSFPLLLLSSYIPLLKEAKVCWRVLFFPFLGQLSSFGALVSRPKFLLLLFSILPPKREHFVKWIYFELAFNAEESLLHNFFNINSTFENWYTW